MKKIALFLLGGSYQIKIIHKIAYKLNKNNFKVLALFIARLNVVFNSIEIHPQVFIPETTSISHGMGTVIGGGCSIGEDVLIRHNVTIGQKGSEKNEILSNKVHPTIKDNVKIGAGACILGGIVIGENSIIGANSVVTKDVPANTCVGGIPAKVLYRF